MTEFDPSRQTAKISSQGPPKETDPQGKGIQWKRIAERITQSAFLQPIKTFFRAVHKSSDKASRALFFRIFIERGVTSFSGVKNTQAAVSLIQKSNLPPDTKKELLSILRNHFASGNLKSIKLEQNNLQEILHAFSESSPSQKKLFNAYFSHFPEGITNLQKAKNILSRHNVDSYFKFEKFSSYSEEGQRALLRFLARKGQETFSHPLVSKVPPDLYYDHLFNLMDELKKGNISEDRQFLALLLKDINSLEIDYTIVHHWLNELVEINALDNAHIFDLTLSAKSSKNISEPIEISPADILQTYRQQQYYEKDTTYEKNPGALEGNVDFSYADQKLGFTYVFDGPDHHNSFMYPVLKKHLDEFNASYAKGIQEQEFHTVEEAKEFLRTQLSAFLQNLKNDETPVKQDKSGDAWSSFQNNPGLVPALSFAQVIKIGEKRHLLYQQFSDTELFLKKADGTVTVLQETRDRNRSWGAHSEKDKEVQVADIDSGDMVFGLSDGVTEYLSLKEIQEILSSCPNDQILPKCKEKIIENGLNWTNRNDKGKPIDKPFSRDTIFGWKGHHLDFEDRTDDISLCAITVL